MSQSQAAKLRVVYMAQIQAAQSMGASEMELAKLRAKYKEAYQLSKGIKSHDLST